MSKKEYSLIVFALMIFVSSIYCVIQSGNYFAHYMLLLIIPLTFLLGTLLGLFDSKLSYLSVSVKQQSLLLISGGMLFISCIFYYKSRNPSVFTAAVSNYNSANSISEVAKRILLYTSSDDRIAVWGWASNYHVETQLAQGSRDTHSFYQIRKSFLQDYYLDRYAQDIIKNKPVLFINAVSDKHFVFSDTATQSYHHFPRIKQTIDSLYLYVEEVEGVKIYILKSRASSYSKVQANIN